MNGRHGRAGFTLVELMITVSIIAIIGLIAVPGLFEFIPQYRINNAAKVLATETHLARMKAIAKNKTYLLTFDTTNQQILVKEEVGGTATTVRTIAMDDDFENVTIGYKAGTTGLDGSAITAAVDFGSSGSEIEYRPNGLLAAGGEFYLIPSADVTVKSDRMRAIQVSRSGQVSLYRYDGSQSPPWKEI